MHACSGVSDNMDRGSEMYVSCIVPGFVYREVLRRQYKSDAMNQRCDGKPRIFLREVPFRDNARLGIVIRWVV